MTTASLSKNWMFTNDYTQNPYPFLARLRREQPVSKMETPDGLRAWGGHPVDGRAGGAVRRPDEPRHHQPLRKAIVHAFTPRRVEAMRPRIVAVVDHLLDTMAAAPRQDIVPGLAEPLPIITIAHLMGVPDTDWARFRRWSSTLRGVDPTDPTGCWTSTSNLLSGAIAALLGHPEQATALRANPSLMRSAVDVLPRFTAPAINALQRLTLAPVELGGVRIPAGEIVILSLASANRDDTATPQRPDTLDVTRTKPMHVSFGHGIHFCLGAHLARAQTEIAIDRLFTRFPDTRMLVDYADLHYQPGMAVRPLVPVRLA